MKYLKHETDAWFELTNLIIPEEKDDPEETRAMCHWILDYLGSEVPIHFTAFNPDFKMTDKPRTSHKRLIRSRQIAPDSVLQYVYVGNGRDKKRERIYCPGCKKIIIERNWYELGDYYLKRNRCSHCWYSISGIFDMDGPGRWGRKRVPIKINSNIELIDPTTDSTKIRLITQTKLNLHNRSET